MRRDHQRLLDILDALDSLGRMIDGRAESEFLSDETLRYACAQRLTVVGEAVARLSPGIKGRHETVPWPDIVALRNILVHEYFGIHWPFVWRTVIHDAPALRERIARIVAAEFPA